MSNIDTLNKEINELKNELNNKKAELANIKQQLDGVLAQCRATKQMSDEMNNSNINLRTNIILYQQREQKLQAELNDLKKENAELRSAKASPVKEHKAA